MTEAGRGAKRWALDIFGEELTCCGRSMNSCASSRFQGIPMAEVKTNQHMYTQWCEDFRALQTVFWRVPFFAMTITGGLGAAVLAFDGAPEIKRLLLVFSGICNFVLILIAWRVRTIMETLLKKVYRYEGKEKPKTGFFVLKCFSALFAIVGIILIFAAAFFPTAWLSKEAARATQEGHAFSSVSAPGSKIVIH